MADMFETYRGTVYSWQCDHMGHLNVMHYVGKFDEATWQMFNRMGVTPSFMRENRCGVAAVKQNITYRRELRPGDVISIRTGVVEMRDRVIRFYHEMINEESGEISATMMISGVYMDTETRKALKIPEDILERGRSMIVEIQPLV
jgi:acyl-CoA thioester hydrolase